VVIVPEARDRKGIFYSAEQNPKDNFWLADVEVHLGNSKNTHRGGTGLAIYYLRNIDMQTQRESLFGY